MGIKKHLYGILFGLVLSLYTVYVLLNTFVIVRVFSEFPGGSVTDNAQVTTAGVPTDTSFVQEDEGTGGEAVTDKEPSEPVITDNWRRASFLCGGKVCGKVFPRQHGKKAL